MELILNKGQKGLRQDFLIYNKEYKVFRDGKFIGVAKYLDDEIHGDGFFIEDSYGVLTVCVCDEWVFAINRTYEEVLLEAKNTKCLKVLLGCRVEILKRKHVYSLAQLENALGRFNEKHHAILSESRPLSFAVQNYIKA